eukprot:CAMPEP_0115183424 /NCGR_PEP_ID=MMETSP0270-20121206/8446_1 /TAXON_ID=71861 /ORGANISM="Scrippsiella trochoidea, Strain CCMP3099" /LENGTH=86 /DNA_ID=CAMNT_0002596491 /DNA_START=74 /DNA_END=334 /DNA_ORIENTATION=-
MVRASRPAVPKTQERQLRCAFKLKAPGPGTEEACCLRAPTLGWRLGGRRGPRPPRLLLSQETASPTLASTTASAALSDKEQCVGVA